jgi:hypothetical protein
MILARRFLVTGTRRQRESRRWVRRFAAFLRIGAGPWTRTGSRGLRRRRSGGGGQVSQPGQDLWEQERNEHMLAAFGDLLRAADIGAGAYGPSTEIRTRIDIPP